MSTKSLCSFDRHEPFLEKFCSATTESEWRSLREKDLGKIAFAMFTMNYGDQARLEGLSSALSTVSRLVLSKDRRSM